MDTARAGADHLGEWRNWSFLTLQVQLAAERHPSPASLAQTPEPGRRVTEEHPASEWALAKSKIRAEVGEIPFSNWFANTRQVERKGSRIAISVADEASRFFLESEYGQASRKALAELDVHEIEWIVHEAPFHDAKGVQQRAAQTSVGGVR